MRVLHILDHSIPILTGYTLRTRSILREQRRLGLETIHVTSSKHYGAKGVVEEFDDLRFYRTAPLTTPPWNWPVASQWGVVRGLRGRIRSVVAEHAVDVMHAHSPVLTALAGIGARGRGPSRTPLVYEIRAYWEDAAVDHGTARQGGARYRAGRALEGFALRRVDAVTTIAQGLFEDLVRRGIPQDRITLIPNAVDLETFVPQLERDRALETELRLSGRPVLGFLGSFYGYEGLDLLLRALPDIRRAVPGVVLLLVGGGLQETVLRGLADDLGVQDDVRFTGRVAFDDIARYYSLVDVLVYPRKSLRLTELVTPLKPLEAMAQAKPVIASAVGGHRELIRDGETGVLFPADDVAALARCAVRLLQSPDERIRLGLEGRTYVERERTWPVVVRRYAQVYSDATSRVRGDR